MAKNDQYAQWLQAHHLRGLGGGFGADFSRSLDAIRRAWGSADLHNLNAFRKLTVADLIEAYSIRQYPGVDPKDVIPGL